MIRRLVRHEDGRALVIEQSILDLLGITDDTPLDILTDGETMIVSIAEMTDSRKKIEAALARIHERYGESLGNLVK